MTSIIVSNLITVHTVHRREVKRREIGRYENKAQCKEKRKSKTEDK
jgi:hypothetical protein